MLGAIIGIGSIFAHLFGAKKASDASKDAAKLQVAATEKAQQANERAYSDQKQLMSPYTQAGTMSLADLQQRLYGGQPASDRMNGFVQAAQRGVSPGMGGAGQPGAQPQGMTLADMQQRQQGAPMQPGGGGLLGAAQRAGMGGTAAGGAQAQGEPMVLMAGPDGSQKQIPQSRVQDAMARGARRVA